MQSVLHTGNIDVKTTMSRRLPNAVVVLVIVLGLVVVIAIVLVIDAPRAGLVEHDYEHENDNDPEYENDHEHEHDPQARCAAPQLRSCTRPILQRDLVVSMRIWKLPQVSIENPGLRNRCSTIREILRGAARFCERRACEESHLLPLDNPCNPDNPYNP